MEIVNKIPRWFLMLIFIAFISLIGFVGEQVWAESQTTKRVAYQARTSAEELKLVVAGISAQIQEIKNTQAKDHDETRIDLKEIRDILLHRP